MNVFKRLCFAIFILPLSAGTAFAADPMQQYNSNAVWFENWVGLSNATLKVVAPNGQITEIFAATGTPVFQLTGSEVLDGYYYYELTAATDVKEKIVNQIDSGRGDAQLDSVAVGYYLTGAFSVSRGAIITPPEIKEDNEG